MNFAAICCAAVLAVTQVPVRDTNGKEYILSGQNSMQKIYYAASSSYASIYKGDKAIDEDASTSWISSSTGADHWLEVDFGVKRLFTRMAVKPGKKNNYETIKGFRLQFLYEGEWFDFAKINLLDEDIRDSMDDNDGFVSIDLGGVDASTFRIYVPAAETYGGYAAIAEVACYMGSSRISYFDRRLKGLQYPIKNGYLPESDYNYPNAPRSYRGGRHVGLDILYYHEEGSFDAVPVNFNTEVVSAGDGVVIRADHEYKPMTEDEWRAKSSYKSKFPTTFVKRDFGGRQVWVDHGNGVVVTYNHLSKIASGIKAGKKVKRGQKLGYAGNSGLLGETRGNTDQTHLHFEVWVDGYYLGYGMEMEAVRRYVKWMFFDLQ